MTHSPVPLSIKTMTPSAVEAQLASRPALLVPVGSTEQHGPHLPVGADTIIVERLADDLSARFGILRAPTLEYGVNLSRLVPGSVTASLRRKTLHRVMNELIESWEMGAGIREFYVLTAEGYGPHQEALSTILVRDALVRAIDIFGLDFEDRLERPGGPVHGGELETSLLLFLNPDLVHMEDAADRPPSRRSSRYRRGSAKRFIADPKESIGYPTLGSAEKGARLYSFILERVASTCLAPEVE